ncbi:MAG: hypothetical protein Q8O67_09050 [Deltaproteobacteria bacterium]|nr:hypothetical protein [Deltaproteobacteria bacterium]
MSKRPRGYLLLLVVGLCVGIASTGLIAFARVGEANRELPALHERTQLLWLARSALVAGPAARKVVVDAAGGPATVLVEVRREGTALVATAKLGSARATVSSTGEERYER